MALTLGRTPQRVLLTLTLLWVLVIQVVHTEESAIYRYRLIESIDNRLCQHMTAVYNKYFSRPFDGRVLSKAKQESAIPTYSVHPRSPEFDTIKWQLKTYPLTGPNGDKTTWTTLVAKFDIDNDGIEDVVAKSSFFRDAPDDQEELRVFSSLEFDLDAVSDGKEFFVGQGGKEKPRFITVGAAILRPFLVDGNAYLSAYDYKRYTALPPGMGNAPNSAHTPPEYMRIYQYRGGGHQLRGFESELRITQLCVIGMSRAK